MISERSCDTEVMMLKIHHYRNKLHFIKYIQIEKSIFLNCNNMFFYCIFDLKI